MRLAGRVVLGVFVSALSSQVMLGLGMHAVEVHGVYPPGWIIQVIPLFAGLLGGWASDTMIPSVIGYGLILGLWQMWRIYPNAMWLLCAGAGAGLGRALRHLLARSARRVQSD